MWENEKENFEFTKAWYLVVFYGCPFCTLANRLDPLLKSIGPVKIDYSVSLKFKFKDDPWLKITCPDCRQVVKLKRCNWKIGVASDYTWDIGCKKYRAENIPDRTTDAVTQKLLDSITPQNMNSPEIQALLSIVPGISRAKIKNFKKTLLFRKEFPIHLKQISKNEIYRLKHGVIVHRYRRTGCGIEKMILRIKDGPKMAIPNDGGKPELCFITQFCNDADFRVPVRELFGEETEVWINIFTENNVA